MGGECAGRAHGERECENDGAFVKGKAMKDNPLWHQCLWCGVAAGVRCHVRGSPEFPLVATYAGERESHFTRADGPLDVFVKAMMEANASTT